MNFRHIIRTSLILSLTMFSSCRLIGMLQLSGVLEVDVQTSVTDWGDHTVILKSIGTENQEITRGISWGHSAHNYFEGEWQLEVQVIDDTDSLVGLGVQTVNVQGGKTTSAVVIVNDLQTNSLTTSINGDLENILEGETRTLSAAVDGGSGEYDYRWYLDGTLIDSDATGEIPGTLRPGEYQLELIVVDTSLGIAGSDSVSFSIIDPYTRVAFVDESATVNWDSPDNSDNVVGYNLYVQEHGAEGWVLLATVMASSNPEYTITSSVLEPGLWDLGITSISETGNESVLHSSLDGNAIPALGWYMDWNT